MQPQTPDLVPDLRLGAIDCQPDFPVCQAFNQPQLEDPMHERERPLFRLLYIQALNEEGVQLGAKSLFLVGELASDL